MLSFEQKNKIGWGFVTAQMSLSALGRRALKGATMRSEDEKIILKRDLDNIESALIAFRDFPDDAVALSFALHKLKDVIPTFLRLRRSVLSESDLFEIKAFLLNLREVIDRYESLAVCMFTGISFSDISEPLNILDPYGNGALSFELYDKYSDVLAEIRRDKLSLEKELMVAPQSQVLLTARAEIIAEERKEEEKVLAWLSKSLLPYVDDFVRDAESAGALDFALQKARLAEDWSLCRPVISSDKMEFVNMFNPEVAQSLEGIGKEFTPVSISLKRGTTVISGANMSGKSVVLKTVALNTLLALSGFYVFADSAKVSFINDILFLSLDLEDSQRGLSSFGGEIVALNEALSIADEGSCLVILDEFARGTNPVEGAKIARAVAKYFNKSESYCLMTTHFNGVSNAANAHYRVKGIADDSQIFDSADIADAIDYSLVPVSLTDPVPADAVKVCKMLNLRSDILEKID